MLRILLVLLATLPELCLAQSSGPSLSLSGFIPPSTDVTVTYFLNTMFGGLTGAAGGTDPLLSMMGTFNAGIMLLGSIYLAYTFIAGTAQSAHDGSMLGQKWSSMWIPIRTVIGVAAITPIASGYCVAQFVVMGLITQGVGFADLLWSQYASSASSMAQVALMPNFSKGADLAQTTLQQQLCVVTLNSELAAAGKDSLIAKAYGTATVRDLTLASGTVSTAAPANNLDGVCGTYNIPSNTSSQASSLNSWFGSTFSPVDFQSAISAVHKAAYASLQSSINAIASQIYISNDAASGSSASTSQAAIAANYSAAINAYNQAINNGVTAAINSASQSNEVAKNAGRDGWGMAGAWYMKYLYVKQALTATINQYPILTPPDTQNLPPEFQEAFNDFQARSESIANKTSFTNEMGFVSQATQDQKGDSKIENWMRDKFSPPKSSGFFSLSGTDGQAFKDPILAAKDFGDFVFNWGVGATFGVAGAAALAASTMVGYPAVSASIATVQPLIFMLTGGLMGFGGSLAFYLPMAPFILWFGVVLGWVVMVAEAIVIAPLWAVSHLHPDGGDGIKGKAEHGYGLLLALTLRPALSIFGLVLSMIIMIPVGKLFNDVFWSVFQSSQNGSTGPFIFLGGLVVYSVVFIGIVHKVFSLIHIIPDQALKWIGGHGSDLGSYAGDLSRQGQGGAEKVGGVMGAVAGKALEGAQNARALNKDASNNKNDMVAKTMARAETDGKEGDHMAHARSEGSNALAKALQSGEISLDAPAEDLEAFRMNAEQAAFDQSFGKSIDPKNANTAGKGAYQFRSVFKQTAESAGITPSASDYNQALKNNFMPGAMSLAGKDSAEIAQRAQAEAQSLATLKQGGIDATTKDQGDAKPKDED